MRIEIVEALGFVHRSLEEQRWAGKPAEALAVPAWKEHREVFAGAADRHRWDTVSLAFTIVLDLRGKAEKVEAWSMIDPDSPQEQDLIEAKKVILPALLELETFGEFDHSPHPLRTRIGRWRAKRHLARLGIPPSD